MRQLLNNPWVVLGLCTVAVVILYFSADEIDVQQVIPQAVRAAESAQLSKVEVVPIETATIDLDQVDWPRTLTRDPFAPTSHRAESFQQGGEEDEEPISDRETSIDVSSLLRLTAVALQPEPKVAMINRKLVTEGDRIEGLRIARIESDGVWLNGPSGPHHLGFDTDSVMSRTDERQEEVLMRQPQKTNEVERSKKETSFIDSRDCSDRSTCS